MDRAEDAIEVFEVVGDGLEVFRRLSHAIDGSVDA